MGATSDGLGAAATAIQTVLGCPVVVAEDTEDCLRRFEQAYCFDPALQPAFTYAWLTDFLTGLDGGVVHELQEPLGIAVTFFWLDGRLATIGPYTGHAVHTGDAEELLGRLHIPGAHLQAYKLYRSRFAIIDSEFVMRGALALLTQTGDVAGVTFNRVSAGAGTLVPGAGDPPQSASYDLINERYATEEAFIRAMADGDERAALAALQHLGEVGQPVSSYLHTPYLGATVLRTMARVAAEQAGLPPVTIDAISQTYAQRLHGTAHTPDLARTQRFTMEMVSEFCRAIHRHHQQPYSGLVRRVMDEIDLHLSQDVSPGDLARRQGVSETHLARRFKAEAGVTITGHIARRRAARAAHLLATTNQPVRDIAAYVGYLDANYFVKVFRSVYGVTPTGYRARHDAPGAVSPPAAV